MTRAIHIYCLAIRYWAQGDTWDEAIQYATVIIGRWDA